MNMQQIRQLGEAQKSSAEQRSNSKRIIENATVAVKEASESGNALDLYSLAVVLAVTYVDSRPRLSSDCVELVMDDLTNVIMPILTKAVIAGELKVFNESGRANQKAVVETIGRIPEGAVVELKELLSWHKKKQSVLLPDWLEESAAKQQQNEVTQREKTTYENIIGGLLELMLGNTPAGHPQSVFTSQNAIKDAILAHYPNLIGARTLDEKFAAANRSIAASKES